MSVKCNKCGYERREADTSPQWQCPSCGVAYNKVGYVAGNYRKPPERPPFKESFHFNPRLLVLGAVLLVLVNTKNIINSVSISPRKLPSQTNDLKAARERKLNSYASVTGTITVPVNVYVEHKSRWVVSDVEKRLEVASKYFGERCDIVFDVRKVSVGDVPGLYGLDRKGDVKYAYLNPDPYNSVFVIFTGEDLVEHRTGYARYTVSSRWYPTANTIYMFEYAIDKKNQLYENYDTVIHEFGHVLMAEGHNQIHRNFLTDYYDGMVVTQEQCKKMRMISSAIVNGDLNPTL